ncbi:MAG: SDR family NAD(P)-dependent oxidoreductase [Myxococcales bacterium]|nr:SDR family NAD(P)-dependent oxidoreductase [Myxococcales bacterium]
MSRVVVITGAGAGLGRALARGLAGDGDTVVLLGRTRAKVADLADEIGPRALALQCDVSSTESVRAAFAAIEKNHPRVDVLINNAAVYQPFLVADATDAQILQTIGTNLTGAILCARAAIPLMGPGGHILNVGSEAVEMTFPHLVLYQASKAGLERFSLGLHEELETQGIKVTMVRAGSMFEEGKTWDVDPEARMRFAQAAMGVGIDLRARPRSHYDAIVDVFRGLLDMPASVQAGLVTLRARTPEQLG